MKNQTDQTDRTDLYHGMRKSISETIVQGDLAVAKSIVRLDQLEEDREQWKGWLKATPKRTEEAVQAKNKVKACSDAIVAVKRLINKTKLINEQLAEISMRIKGLEYEN